MEDGGHIAKYFRYRVSVPLYVDFNLKFQYQFGKTDGGVYIKYFSSGFSSVDRHVGDGSQSSASQHAIGLRPSY